MIHPSLVQAAVLGLVSALGPSPQGQASDPGTPSIEQPSVERLGEKDGCGGKDGCGSKDGCSGKDDKKKDEKKKSV